MNLLFDFAVNKENSTVKVTREFAAPVNDVWAAWTEQDLLDKWWAPKPWMSKTKSMDFREGGRRLYAMVGPAGEEHWALADYKSISPKDNFTFYDGFCDSEGHLNNSLPRSDWDVRFEKAGDHTKVIVVIKHEKLSDLEKIIEMGFKEGFTIALNGLDELFEKAKK